MIVSSTSTHPVPIFVTPEVTHVIYLPYTYLVYDIEIVKAIPSKFDPPLPDIEYCDGWHDYQNMGVSVIGAYDSDTGQYRIFLEDNFEEFFALSSKRDLLVGFNNIKFDNKVLSHLSTRTPLPTDQFRFYDILREIWLSLDLDPDIFNLRTHGGYSLDAVSKANGLPGKSGNGANAAIAWQNGHLGSVIDYCLQDIHLTTKLFQQICCSAQLTDPRIPSTRLVLAHPHQKLHDFKKST